MSLYVITYDVRATHHNYDALYAQLNSWRAAHLQNSVWVADLAGTPSAVRDALQAHMHADDTIGVIQIFPNSDWATRNARGEGSAWLKAHCKP